MFFMLTRYVFVLIVLWKGGRKMEKGLQETRLRELRLDLKLPQWMVAVGSGVDSSRLSILERGAPPRPSEIDKLMGYFKVSEAEIWPELSKEGSK